MCPYLFFWIMFFFAPDIEKSNFLSEEESQHAVKVLRLKEGDFVELVDGCGNYYTAEISFANHKKCEVCVLEKKEEFNELPCRIHIAIAPTKNMDRMEWFAEKVTEVGVSEVTPLLCDHSERKVLKTERLEKIMVSAMKQSKKATLPTLNEMIPFAQFVKKYADFQGEKYVAHCYEQDKKSLAKVYTKSSNVIVMIGPEGDFSEEEVRLAMDCGFVPVSLGNSRLRTETAGLMACHTIHVLNEL